MPPVPHRLPSLLILLTCGLPAVAASRTPPYFAELAAASLALRLNETGPAIDWLERIPAPHRRWEWRHLHARADESLLVLPGQASTVMSVDTHSGRVLTADALGWVTVQSLDSPPAASPASGEPRLGTAAVRFRASESGLFRAVFSPDGSRIATAGADRTCRLWDARTGAALRTVWQHNVPVASVCFSPDGKLLAAAAYALPEPGNPASIYGVVKVFDTATWTEAYELRGGNKPLSALAWSADGRRIAASSWAWVTYAWEARPGAMPAVCDGGTAAEKIHHDAVAFSPDGARLISGLEDGTARIYDAGDGKPRAILRGHADAVTGVAWPAVGEVYTASIDSTIRAWDASSGAQSGLLLGHGRGVRCLATAAGGDLLISGSVDRSVRAWRTGSRWYGGVRLRNPPAVYSVRFSPDGATLAACGWEMIRTWRTRDWTESAAFAGHRASRNALTFLPGSAGLVTTSDDREVRVWRADVTGNPSEPRLATPPHPSGLLAVEASPDGTLLAAGTRAGLIRLTDARTGAVVRDLAEPKGGTWCLRFTPDGKLLLGGSGDGLIRAWDRSGRIAFTLEGHHGSVTGLDVDVTGGLIASAGRDGTVRLWSRAKHRLLRTLQGHDVAVNCVRFTRDGRRVASGSSRLLFHDVETGAGTVTLTPMRDTLYALDFSPDGERLAVAGVSGEIAILDTRRPADRLPMR